VPDLLVEIGCEELPAAACRQAEAQLPGLLGAGLERAGLAAAERRVHVAPRRLAVLAFGLPAERPAERSEVRGPRVDAPEQALAGFARKHRLDPAALERREGFVWAVSEGAPTPVAELVPDLVRGLVEGIQFSKSMRWEGGRFSRPIRWLVVKLDDAVVPMLLAGVASGDTTSGHRYEGGHARVGTAATYLDDLRAVRAMAASGERRAAIVAGLDDAGPWQDPAGKLDEVVHLVEWPVVLQGRFDARYLELPDRVVETAMQSHQRYFPVRRVGADLEPRFLFVANGGDPDIVRAGNEEVLVGRLDDAAFAYRRDLERGLDAMAAELGRVSFLEGSGSLADKAARLGPLVERLCAQNGLSDDIRAAALRAAALCKADLVSGLVSEFSALEGYAGSVYARAGGESEAVAAAIEEHHRPSEAGGELPASEAGAVLSVADKADTLAVAFGLGLEPTGSRDPFGLRRAAAGVVVIALARGLTLAPLELVGDAATAFLLDRLEPILLEEGVTVEEVRAARGSGASEPAAVADLARRLHAFAGRERDALRDAYNRCVRIAGETAAGEPDPELLREPAEQALAEAIHTPPGSLDEAAALVPAVNRFFDDVLVMDKDERVRANRLRLVAQTAAMLRRHGDFGQLPG
jgi:tetrameric-type glycyl-tRNA synthetase beta subunit